MNRAELANVVASLRGAGLSPDAVGLAEALWLSRVLPGPEGVLVRSDIPGAEPRRAKRVKRGRSSRFHRTQRRLLTRGAGPNCLIQLADNVLPRNPRLKSYAAAEVLGGEDFIPAKAVRVAAGAALPGALQVGRALRPLISYRKSRFQETLDEDATAERSAESEGLIAPVFRPERERLLDVALVIDDSTAMAVWRKTVIEFQQLLEHRGAFRDVRQWHIRFAPEVRLSTSSGMQVSHKALLDPAGHRLIVLFTQGTHPAWAQRELTAWLWDWAASGPLVIAEALPELLWVNTKFGEATAIVRAHQPAMRNTHLTVERPWWYERDGPRLLAVPVFSLSPEAAATWANMLMAVRGTGCPAFLFDAPEHVAETSQSAATNERTGEERLSLFRANASEEAYESRVLLVPNPVQSASDAAGPANDVRGSREPNALGRGASEWTCCALHASTLGLP